MNEILEENKLKKTHLTQHAKIISSIKKDLSQTHLARGVLKDPIKKISLAKGAPTQKSKIHYMGSIQLTARQPEVKREPAALRKAGKAPAALRSRQRSRR